MSNRVLKIEAMVRNTLLDEMPNISNIWQERSCHITDVSMSKDLSLAKVFVAVKRGDESEVILALNQCAKTAAFKVTKANNFRRAPSIRFLKDESYSVLKECELIKKILLEDDNR